MAEAWEKVHRSQSFRDNLKECDGRGVRPKQRWV